MRRGFHTLVAAAVLSTLSAAAIAQTYPAPEPPTVTANDREWYQLRSPIFFSDSIYIPSGPPVYFNRLDMVRSGRVDGVPFYIRTTLEPYSILFIPIAGGLLQPYERRRWNEMAGLADPARPAIPLARPIAGIEAVVEDRYPRPVPTYGFAPVVPTDEGAMLPAPGFVGPVQEGEFRSAAKPQGLNGVYIEFDGQRWFNNGSAIPLDTANFSSVGTYRGSPVFMKSGDRTTIYVPVAESVNSLVTPYSIRPSKRR